MPLPEWKGTQPRPLLMVDIDGVVSLFGSRNAGFPGRADTAPQRGGRGGPQAARGARTGNLQSVDGSFHSIDGIPHFLSSTAAAHLLALSRFFELVWASGWEEKANEYLPHLLGLPAQLPFLRFSRELGASGTPAHWKLTAIEAYAGSRALAWIDDAFNPACHAWAKARGAPTLLVRTAPEHGLTSREAELLMAWAQERSQAGQPQD